MGDLALVNTYQFAVSKFIRVGGGSSVAVHYSVRRIFYAELYFKTHNLSLRHLFGFQEAGFFTTFPGKV
jgi:hypothetical protein